MAPAISTSPPLPAQASRPRSRMRSYPLGLRASRRGEASFATSALATYIDADGRTRELLALPGHAGSVLVLDRDATTLCDRRLLAHLAHDEPPENAMLVCRHYLQDANGRWCRRVRPGDLEIAPFDIDSNRDPNPEDELDAHPAVEDRDRNAYRLILPPGEGSAAQLRWCRRVDARAPEWEQTSLRDVVGAIQSYEPMRTLTQRAIALHGADRNIGVSRLGGEFDRLCASPVVLNRGLREAVLSTVQRGEATMSEIALRCGVVKRDRRGNSSGETSWLARRIGIMPEGGETKITPWIHSDVLATIARRGLGVSPREVELQ